MAQRMMKFMNGDSFYGAERQGREENSKKLKKIQ